MKNARKPTIPAAGTQPWRRVTAQLGIEYPGAICQVMNRGDRREPVFQNNSDHRRFPAAREK